MKVQLKPTQGTVLVTREKGDMRIKNESHLLYRVKQELLKQGYDVIKKRMWRDGHLVDDEQQYVRTRKAKPHNFAIYDTLWAIRDSAKAYNLCGYINLTFVSDIHGKSPQGSRERWSRVK